MSSAQVHPEARSALRTRLLAMPGGLLPPTDDIVGEGFDYTPTTGKKFLEDRLVVNHSTPRSLGVIEHGMSYILTLKFPSNQGTAAIEALAGALTDWFKVSTKFTYGSTTVLCERASRVGGLVTANGWVTGTVEVRATVWTTD